MAVPFDTVENVRNKGILFSAGRDRRHMTGEEVAELFGGRPFEENMAEVMERAYTQKFGDYSEEFRKEMADRIVTEGSPVKAVSSLIRELSRKPELTADERKFADNLHAYMGTQTALLDYGINDVLWAMDEYVSTRENGPVTEAVRHRPSLQRIPDTLTGSSRRLPQPWKT